MTSPYRHAPVAGRVDGRWDKVESEPSTLNLKLQTLNPPSRKESSITDPKTLKPKSLNPQSSETDLSLEMKGPRELEKVRRFPGTLQNSHIPRRGSQAGLGLQPTLIP